MSDAPTISIEAVNAAIKGETYTVLPNGRTTVCQLTLDNGFTVEGYSACVSAANFDAEKGRTYSREDAVRKIWPLLGFRLADQLAGVHTEPPVVDVPPTSARRIPIVAFKNGLFQTTASVVKLGADVWLMANLQLRSDFPVAYAMSEIERQRVWRNTYCNADGSLEGSSAPPLVFEQADSVTEVEKLNRCRATNRLFDVKPRLFGGYMLDPKRHLIDVLGMERHETRPRLYALRAQDWAAVEEWCARAQAN